VLPEGGTFSKFTAASYVDASIKKVMMRHVTPALVVALGGKHATQPRASSPPLHFRSMLTVLSPALLF
jgi:hypothetical protein